MIVGTVRFSRSSDYYGMRLCLDKADMESVDVTEESAAGADVILFSLFWYKDVLALENFLRRSGLKSRKDKPILIAGGLQATMTPELVAEMVDYVFVGDGEDELATILSQISNGERPESAHLFRKGNGRPPEPAECQVSAYCLLVHGQVAGGVARKAKEKIKQHLAMRNVSSVYRMEIARGCKFKCAFCALSAFKSYREVPTQDVLLAIDEIPRRVTCALFAPERTCHSGWHSIQQKIAERGLRDNGSDVRLEHLDNVERDSAIFGLEGFSKRLRAEIGKGWTEDFIIEKMRQFCTTGRRLHYGAKLTSYFIGDLPGECAADWEELVSLLERLSREEWTRNLTLAPVLNPLSPKPRTKLAEATVHPLRNYAGAWESLCRGGDGVSRWGFRLQEYGVWGPLRRTLDTIIQRGGSHAYRLIEAIPDRLLLHGPATFDSQVASARQTMRTLVKRSGLNPVDVFGEGWDNNEVAYRPRSRAGVAR